MSCSRESKKAKHDSTTTNPNWLELPRDITSNILQRLCAIQILKNARNVCAYWWNICKDPFTWRQIYMLDQSSFARAYLKVDPDGFVNFESLVPLCKYAVDLSCGHLEEIYIYDFATDDLLQHIAYRASKLRCIRLNSCTMISDEGWCEFVKKLPMLEEIHISHSILSKKSVEVIGQSYPLLKSLTFTGKWYGEGESSEWDAEASIIAKTMPKLSYLDIHQNPLTDDGLISILNACPLLESLNIETCSHLKFGASLSEMLHNQIKDLKVCEYDETNYSDDGWEVDYWEKVQRPDDEDEDDEINAYFLDA